MAAYFTSEKRKLKNIQFNLESDATINRLINKRSEKNEINLNDLVVELEKNRAADLQKYESDFIYIFNFLKNNKKLLIEDENLNDLDIKAFKNDMIQVKECIQNIQIRAKSNIILLEEEEQKLSKEVEFYNDKIEQWAKPLKYFSDIDYKFNQNPSIEIAKEVKDFLDFVTASNGHENGWTNEDHLLFLKIRNKHKNINIIANKIHDLLPDKSLNEVKKHEIWYRKYLFLKSKKGEALNNWRKTRAKVNTCLIKKVENNNLSDNNKNNCDKREKIVKSCTNMKEKLENWKKERNMERIKEMENYQLSREKHKELERKQKLRNQEMKKIVNTWRQSKVFKEQIEALEKQLLEYNEKKLKAAEANKMIKKFQSQDDILVAKMKVIKQSKNKEGITTRSKSGNHIKISKDPDRIFKPTKQWIQRSSKNDDQSMEISNNNFVPNIKNIPKLGVPEWRKCTRM